MDRVVDDERLRLLARGLQAEVESDRLSELDARRRDDEPHIAAELAALTEGREPTCIAALDQAAARMTQQRMPLARRVGQMLLQPLRDEMRMILGDVVEVI